ncbi:MAG: indole-3-glycerol phosphate synthase TrpC [Steroidobacteraceae bacterium]
MSFLAEMAAGSRTRVTEARRRAPESVLRARIHELPPPPSIARHADGFDLIAEVKLRSPAAGSLSRAGGEDAGTRAAAYARAGAAGVSVLTEPRRFDGAMEHLEGAAKALAPLRIPAMRKDFLVDPYQVLEARVAGAGGVLVILRMLTRRELDAILDATEELALFALLEAFDANDLELAHEVLAARPRERLLVGLNCRDLATLQIVPDRLIDLADRLPRGAPRVAESGVTTADDAARVAAAGYDFALVGSALMRAPDSAVLVREMLAAGRAARRPPHPSLSPASGGEGAEGG